MINTIEYFLSDPEFVRWVKHPDRELDEFWKNWMEANPESIPNLKIAKELVAGLHFTEIKAPSEMKDDLLSSILKESHSVDVPVHDINKQTYKPKKSFWDKLSNFNRVAAILVVATIFALLFSPSQQEPTSELLAVAPEMIEKSTAKGEKLSLTLPDGSKVRLNSASKISYPKTFASQSREIFLYGEAFFEVAKDATKPFTVATEMIATTALGTSFNVSAYQNEETNVSLVTGKVAVKMMSNDSEPLLLEKGESARFKDHNTDLQKEIFDESKVLAWTNKEILFENTPLDKAIRTLENWYGVNISIQNRPSSLPKLSGRFKDESLKNVLEGLSYSVRFEYEIMDDMVKIKFQ